jgi:hypothetical protein
MNQLLDTPFQYLSSWKINLGMCEVKYLTVVNKYSTIKLLQQIKKYIYG